MVVVNIGVLTSGGDSPGMNAAIRAVARQGFALDARVVGFRHGLDGIFDSNFIELSARGVGGILDQGGTFLGTGRSARFREEGGPERALDLLAAADVDQLVIIGGDGSMRASKALWDLGLPVVGIPGTIDNDIYGTAETIGFDTALNTILDAVSKIRDTASAHDRVFVIEVMGRESGELAVNAALGGGGDFVLIPEAPDEKELAAEHVAYDHWRGKLHTIIIVAEGCCTADDVAASLVANSAGHEVRKTVLGHIQRGGHPSARDRILASRLGAGAVQALAEGEAGVMVGMYCEQVIRTRLEEVISRKKPLKAELLELVKTLAI